MLKERVPRGTFLCQVVPVPGGLQGSQGAALSWEDLGSSSHLAAGFRLASVSAGLSFLVCKGFRPSEAVTELDVLWGCPLGLWRPGQNWCP